MHKYPYVFLTVGGKQVEQLHGNIEGLGVELSDQEVDEIDAAVPLDIGFPMSMLLEYDGDKYYSRMTSKNVFSLRPAVNLDIVPKKRPPPVHKAGPRRFSRVRTVPYGRNGQIRTHVPFTAKE